MSEFPDPPPETPGPDTAPAAGARPAPEEFERATALTERIRTQVARVVVGQEEVLEQVLAALLAGGHVLVEGVPGLGKTLLVLAIARTFDGKFTRIQFTPDLMPTDVTGHAIFDSETRQFRIRKGPAFTNLLLADEINRAPAKTQAALLEVMQERQISIEGRPFDVPRPFMAMATQNPIEQEGTYPLPEAQLDRFLFKVSMGYPSLEEETAVVRRVTSGRVGSGLDVGDVETVASPDDVVGLQQVTAQVLVDDRLVDYAVRIVHATRAHSGVRVGAGPRASIALIRGGRARALLSGRDFLIPDDLKAVAPAVLGHRILLSPELEIEGQRPQHLIPTLLDQVEAPRQ